MPYRLLFLFIFFAQITLAQDYPDEERVKVLDFQHGADSLLVDSLSLVPGSLKIYQHSSIVDSTAYQYHYGSGYLTIDTTLIQAPLELHYKVLSFGFHTGYQHKSLQLYDSNALFNEIRYAVEDQKQEQPQETLLATPNLMKAGSISRGISVGNRQSVFVNSSLNLQLEGALTEDINIRAAITDQNIPVQPEGNTQQLQNFDNVFIELYNDRVKLTAGDIILQQTDGQVNRDIRDTESRNSFNKEERKIEPYFLRYQRSVQGAQLEVKHGNKGLSKVGMAVSKGRFASIILPIQEGVQGPYQLKTAMPSYQQAYYILANSEKVYLNGQLLKRGFNEDYSIDYNLGEITFTTNVLLTQNSRVNVDFSYADRSYSRSILTASHQQNMGSVQLYSQYFQEKDNKNQTLGFDLTDEDKQTISESGDSRQGVYISSVDSIGDDDPYDVEYQTNMGADVPGVGNLYDIRYLKSDTLVDGNTYEYYYFSSKGVFSIGFTEVGFGNGHYVINSNSINGASYEWIAPLGGVPQGNYAPVKLLKAPQNKQVWVNGLRADISDHDRVLAEIALSSLDQNTFSPQDDRDNIGSALRINYRSIKRVLPVFNKYVWSAGLQYEFVHQNFSTADPYRDIDFERKWSVLPSYSDSAEQNLLAHDHLLTGTATLEKNSHNRVEYKYIKRQRPGLLQGNQHHFSLDQSQGKWRLNAQAFTLNSVNQMNRSLWNQWSIEVNRQGRLFVPGYRYRVDKNLVASLETDSVWFSLNNYDEHQWFLRSADSVKSDIQLDYTVQQNYRPWLGEMMEADQNQTVGFSSQVDITKYHRVKMRLSYRHNDIINADASDLTNGTQENSLMGNVDWKGSFWQDIFRVDLNYVMANGREIKRSFLYVQVPVGEGEYTWRDDNNNQIQELEEFYEAQYWDERNFVRVYVATNQYILAYTNRLNAQGNLKFPSDWQKSGGIRSWLYRFSNTTFMDIDNKTTNGQLGKRINPWSELAPEHLLYKRNLIKSTLFFNRQNTTWGMDLGYKDQGRKQLLTSGFEERYVQSWTVNSRYNLSRYLGFQLGYEHQNDINRLDLGSQTSTARNYSLVSSKIAPVINWQPGMNFRLSTHYTLHDKESFQPSSELTEAAVFHTAGWSLQYNRLSNKNISASAEYINIKYQGEVNSALSYIMLEALQPGNNVRWSLNWQQKLWNGLQLNATYQGRKSSSQSAIHSGNVMVRALF